MRGWIRSKTRIGPVLNGKVRYRNEQQCSSSSSFTSQEHTVSCVGVVKGVDRIFAGRERREQSFIKARPRQKLTVTLTSISIPTLEKMWVDIETQRSNDSKCIEASKAITRLLCHGQSSSSRKWERDPLQ